MTRLAKPNADSLRKMVQLLELAEAAYMPCTKNGVNFTFDDAKARFVAAGYVASSVTVISARDAAGGTAGQTEYQVCCRWIHASVIVTQRDVVAQPQPQPMHAGADTWPCRS